MGVSLPTTTMCTVTTGTFLIYKPIIYNYNQPINANLTL